MGAFMRWRAAEANAGPNITVLENDVIEALGELEWSHETNIALELVVL